MPFNSDDMFKHIIWGGGGFQTIADQELKICIQNLYLTECDPWTSFLSGKSKSLSG